MKTSVRKLTVFILLVYCMVLLLGCRSRPVEYSEKYDEFLTIDVFCVDANYSGIQTGWFGKLVKDKFNMELNIISPNISGGGDTLFFARSMAGELGDIVIFNIGNGKLRDTQEAGLLLDITNQFEESAVLSQYVSAGDKVKNLVDDKKIYAIPGEVTRRGGNSPSEIDDLTFGTFLRWDYYLEAGAPELNTLEDLLPLLKQMQDKHSYSESGKPAYAISIFKDWDGNMMNLAQQPARMYGYSEVGFVLNKVDGSDYCSIIEEDSIYVRGLKFFFEANQLGIVDPESTTQNWDTLWKKFADGAVHFSPWSFQGPSAYNTIEHLSEGKGMRFVPVNDMELISNGVSPTGSLLAIGIGSKAQDPARMFDFIEWLYSPEGIMANDSAACGVEGLTWDYKDGEMTLTEFGKRAFLDSDGTIMPDEWGGGTWRSGISAINFKTVSEGDINPNTGQAYSHLTWPSYVEDNPVYESWKEYYESDTMLDLVFARNMCIVDPGTDYSIPTESIRIQTMRNQCKDVIVNYSWNMVFAKDEEIFCDLLSEMQQKVKALGYDEVLEFDMECAKEQNRKRDAARQNK